MFSISGQTIDAAALSDALQRSDCGAVVTFEGRVRDHNEGADVDRLDYEAYVALAESEGNQILAEAREHYGLGTAIAVHRTGTLAIGDTAVWVGTAAGHRDAAYAANRYIIDAIKQRVPIWKREHFADGRVVWTGTPT